MGGSGDPTRGRAILLTFIFGLVALDVVVIALYLSTMQVPLDSPKGQIAVITRVGRFLFTLLLVLMLHRGSSVAKWICTVLCVLASLMAAPALFRNPLLAPMVSIYVGFAAALLGSADVEAFMDEQRSRRH